MKARDIYNWDSQMFAALREPARNVVAAYQQAARFLDTVQETVYIEHGLVHTARMIHDLAHEMPKRFDVFGDMLHERHLMTEYPATPELTERIYGKIKEKLAAMRAGNTAAAEEPVAEDFAETVNPETDGTADA